MHVNVVDMWGRKHTVFAVIAFIAAILMFMVHWHHAGDVFTSQNRDRLSEGRRHMGYEHVHREVKTHRLTPEAEASASGRCSHYRQALSPALASATAKCKPQLDASINVALPSVGIQKSGGR